MCDEAPTEEMWRLDYEFIPPHPLCCKTCKSNLIKIDEIANLAHGWKTLNGQLGAVADTLLRLLDKEENV